MSDLPETNEFVPHDDEDGYSEADGTYATDRLGAHTVRDDDDEQSSAMDDAQTVIECATRHDDQIAMSKHLIRDEDEKDISKCGDEDDLATHRQQGGGINIKQNDEDQAPGGDAELESGSSQDSDDYTLTDDSCEDDSSDSSGSNSIYEDAALWVNAVGYQTAIHRIETKGRFLESDFEPMDVDGDDSDDDMEEDSEEDEETVFEKHGGQAIAIVARHRGGLEKTPEVSPGQSSGNQQQRAVMKSIFDDDYRRRKGGTDRRQMNVIPHQLTNQLVAGMKGTMDLHKYIVERTINDIMDTKPFLEAEQPAREKDDDEKEMDITESYNPQVLHTLIVDGRDHYLKLIKSQAKKYVDHMLKAINDLQNFGNPEYDKSRRVSKKKGHISDAKYFKDRVADNIKALRGILHRNKVENVSEDKLKSEFAYELTEYESLMRDNVAEMTKYQKKLVEDINEKIRDAQNARLVPTKRLSVMPRSFIDSTDHAATLQNSLFVRLLKEVENAVNDNRTVSFQEVDLTNLEEREEDNMTIEDLSDRDSFVMPDRVRKVVDESEGLFLRLVKQQLVLASRVEEVMMELLLKEASKSDPKLKEVVIDAEQDRKENRERANSESVRGSSSARGSQARSNRPSEKDTTIPRHSIKIRKYMLNRLRKISIGTIEKAFLDEGRQDVFVSDEVDLAFRRTIANHITTVKHLIELVLAKQADSKILASSAEASLNNLKHALDTYQKKANEIQPPPVPWNPEEENPLFDEDDATPAELAEGGRRSTQGGSRASRTSNTSRSRSASRTRSSVGPNNSNKGSAHGFADDVDPAASGSRSSAGMSMLIDVGKHHAAQVESVAMGLSTTSLQSSSSDEFFAAPTRPCLKVHGDSSDEFELSIEDDDFEDAREDIQDDSD